MCDVTKKNFPECFTKIQEELKTASFIAIDAEFSGLLSDLEFKSSLFDSGDDRYLKLKACVQQIIIMETGITIFRFDRDAHKFVASVYNFYTFPHSFGSIDTRFLFQASCIEFLCSHKFDFNKVMYEGIPYLNIKQESIIRKELQGGSLFRHLERNISLENEKIIQLECSKIADWAASASVGDDVLIKVYWIGADPKLMNFILHQEIRRRFNNIWTYTAPENQIRIEMITESRHAEFLKNGISIDLEDSALDSLIGFSKVIKLLINSKKPIVGHNLFLDLVTIYNQFYLPLPKTYKEFKSSINLLFPQVYDTKFLSFELKKILKREDLWTSNALGDLYEYFKNGRGQHLVSFVPQIDLANGIDVNSMKYHEAGWDSFVTGYCFIRLGFIFAAHKYNQSLNATRIMTCTEMFSALMNMKGQVNLIRANISNINLQGEDPVSTRPELLHVSTRKKHKPIDIIIITELFAKYGSVDVKPFSKKSALVAVGNHGSAKDILRDFKNHQHFVVSSYSTFRHTPIAKVATWTSLLAVGGLCSWFTYKHILKK